LLIQTEVGADAVGGSEQVLTILDRALTKAGHRSIVIAAAKETIGRACAGVGQGRTSPSHLLSAQALSIDLVHMHSLDFHHYLPSSQVRVLATLHLSPDWYPPQIFTMRRARFRMNCVSWSQHKSCPRCSNLLDPVPNGVDVDRLDADLPKQEFALAPGRICPEKGYHMALEATHRSGTPMILAGELAPYDLHQRYFQRDDRTPSGPLAPVFGQLVFQRSGAF